MQISPSGRDPAAPREAERASAPSVGDASFRSWQRQRPGCSKARHRACRKRWGAPRRAPSDACRPKSATAGGGWPRRGLCGRWAFRPWPVPRDARCASASTRSASRVLAWRARAESSGCTASCVRRRTALCSRWRTLRLRRRSSWKRSSRTSPARLSYPLAASRPRARRRRGRREASGTSRATSLPGDSCAASATRRLSCTSPSHRPGRRWTRLTWVRKVSGRVEQTGSLAQSWKKWLPWKSHLHFTSASHGKYLRKSELATFQAVVQT